MYCYLKKLYSYLKKNSIVIQRKNPINCSVYVPCQRYISWSYLFNYGRIRERVMEINVAESARKR